VARPVRPVWACCPPSSPGHSLRGVPGAAVRAHGAAAQARAAHAQARAYIHGALGTHQHGAHRRLLLAACASAGIVATMVAVCARKRMYATCEAAAPATLEADAAGGAREHGEGGSAQRAPRNEQWPGFAVVVVRLVRHALVFVPLALLYLPCRVAGDRAHDLWWRWAIFAIEASGPALVKLGQWAATRSDMFPSDLCRRLSQLHSNARAHPLALSAGDLQELLRAGGYALVSIDEEPIGSGCIAQVHRAVIAPRTTADGTADALEQQQQRAVAVKIVHPGPDLTAPECSPLRPNHCPHLPPTALSSAAGCP